MSQFRAASIYISSATRRSLKMIARGEGVEKTVDEVADRLLSETIATRYPGLVNLQKEIDALENDMIQKIKAAQQ